MKIIKKVSARKAEFFTDNHIYLREVRVCVYVESEETYVTKTINNKYICIIHFRMIIILLLCFPSILSTAICPSMFRRINDNCIYIGDDESHCLDKNVFLPNENEFTEVTNQIKWSATKEDVRYFLSI